ncbi:hypothetical protein GGR43_001707 [Sphingobium jiangsuense]|uniref:Uncharacterized protein n=1 Tax=Sphingobium jiangsuense TaxID=870476 RepID=A0A7W6FPV1_9SPHN|nr:hypothetical protein [Sphingobium jiangsuense]MBB3925992.1 hypothetical protein [Sphingobium jiangsuense]
MDNCQPDGNSKQYIDFIWLNSFPSTGSAPAACNESYIPIISADFRLQNVRRETLTLTPGRLYAFHGGVR